MALRDWTPEQDATIRRMRARDRATWAEVAAHTGIPLSTLRKRGKRLDLPMEYVRRGGRGRIPWPAEKIAALTDMAGKSLPWDAIAAALGISRNAVLKQARMLGLCRPARKREGAAVVKPVPEYRPPETQSRWSVEALPAGAYWALICVGTCLEGVPWNPVP